ncbi:MAG: hypothetical protein U9Q79_08515 [Candidatus Hydrogenedentes bacterium]|nr:hypothetical protein [Candidatus Hydrogenedentota bacterium]
MGERIAALAALSRIRAIAEQIPTEVPSAPGAAQTIPEQGADAFAVSRPLQEIAGLRHMAETTSKRVTPNTNAQRADVVGSALSQETESTVPAPNSTEPKQVVADVVAANTRNRLSFNRAILETLRGGFETARATVPSIEEQREAIRQALANQRAEAQPQRSTMNEQTPAETPPPVAPRHYNPEADALGLLAGAPAPPRVPPSPYPVSGQEPLTSNGNHLNFLA